jgi:hypothetical protein
MEGGRMTWREIIVFAAQSGIPPIWIAYELGTTNNSVKAILSQERAKGVNIPRYTARRKGRAHVPATQSSQPARKEWKAAA